MANPNPNGSPSFKATKNPGKLNTSFWETKDPKSDGAGKPKKKGRKKKKTKMTAMWETKFEAQKKKVESTTYKSSPKKRSSKSAPAVKEDEPQKLDLAASDSKPQDADKENQQSIQNTSSEDSTAVVSDPDSSTNAEAAVSIAQPEPEPEEVESSDIVPESAAANEAADEIASSDANGSTTNGTLTTETNASTDTTAEPTPSSSKKKNKLASKFAHINLGALKGGVPPSLQKMREEAKTNEPELSSQEFERPIIPASAQRKRSSKKDDIFTTTSIQIKQVLSEYLSQAFVFDDTMILNRDVLCMFLRDIAGIDLSLIGENHWDANILTECLQTVFGDEIQGSYGYKLRAM